MQSVQIVVALNRPEQSAALIQRVRLKNMGIITIPIMPSLPQARLIYVPDIFVPSQPTVSLTVADALLKAVGVGAAVWLAGKGLKAIFSEPRDCYKYHYVQGGRLRHGGITNSLYRREQEHRARWSGGAVQQVGRRVTRASALAWERKYGF